MDYSIFPSLKLTHFRVLVVLLDSVFNKEMNKASGEIRQMDLSIPLVMGILNLTPDSFFDGAKYQKIDAQLQRVEQMLHEGASVIDIGAVSTRPGAPAVSEVDEIKRLIPSLSRIRRHFTACFISVDTFRPAVARMAIDHGADMINDIYGGRYEEGMFETIASYHVPYILMHMKGTPVTMQQNPVYTDVVAEVAYFFEQQLVRCRETGMREVFIDPGFGFGKTVEHNYALLSRLDEFKSFGVPIVAGLSRKSMINQVLQTTADEARNGTTVLNTIALIKGADILRVHDVKEAVEAIRLVRLLS
jgi:dihydropteroate synthase